MMENKKSMEINHKFSPSRLRAGVPHGDISPLRIPVPECIVPEPPSNMLWGVPSPHDFSLLIFHAYLLIGLSPVRGGLPLPSVVPAGRTTEGVM